MTISSAGSINTAIPKSEFPQPAKQPEPQHKPAEAHSPWRRWIIESLRCRVSFGRRASRLVR